MEATNTLELIGGQQLQLERLPDANVVKVIGPEGAVKLTIYVTPSGPVLHIDGDGLEIRCSGALAIDAQHLLLRGREGLELSTGGDAGRALQGGPPRRSARPDPHSRSWRHQSARQRRRHSGWRAHPHELLRVPACF